MRKIDTKLCFAACHLIIIVLAWGFHQMVYIVDGESAGYSSLIVAVAIGECGMKAHYWQIISLELRFERIEGLTCHSALFYLCEMLGNLATGVSYLLVVERSIQELRSARLHLSGCLD